MAGSLSDYIKEGLKRGYSEVSLRQALAQQGWGPGDINEAFASLQGGGAQRPMQPVEPAVPKPAEQPGKKKLRRIGVLSFAKMFSLVSALIGLIIGIFQAVFLASIVPIAGMLLGAESTGLIGMGTEMFAGLGLIVVVLVPALMALFGFITGVLAAFSYNLLAGKLGGFDLEFE